MTRTNVIKTSFSNGEVSGNLLGRGDLRAYENGALELRNVYIQPTGGVTRRDGMVVLDWLENGARLIPFEFNTEQTYLLVLSDRRLRIYENGWLIHLANAPYALEDIPHIVWTQSADTLLLVHPDYPPQSLQRQNDYWSFREWNYGFGAGAVYMPFFRFDRSATALTITGTVAVNDTITLSANADVFSAEHIGTLFKLSGKQVEIITVTSPTSATAKVLQAGLVAATPITDWQEQAFSELRGWPSSVTFHQDRLVIGGSRELPNRLWFSKSGDLFNFDTGTGLDDEAIEFALLSDQINAIRAVFSGRHLQIFTSGAEWMVSGEPLTPTTLQVRRQTRVGSATQRYIPPVDVDGATYFVSRSRNQVRRFLFADVEQAYQSGDVSMVAHDLVKDAIDMDYDQTRRLLYVVREDGKFATMTVYYAEQVMAWTLHETAGKVLSVAVVGTHVYMLVERGDYTTLETLDPETHLDGAVIYEDEGWANDTFGLMEHFDGETVSAIADGIFYDDLPVDYGEVVLPEDVFSVTFGRKFMHTITPLPLANISNEGTALATRMVQVSLRLKDTGSVHIDTGRGARNIRIGDNAPLTNGEELPQNFSGDVNIRAYGWHKDLSKPLWQIAQDDPLPFTLLSVSTEFKINT